MANCVYQQDSLVVNLAETLENVERPWSSECCIYKVPKKLRSVNEAAYTPQFVSIGPLHYGQKTLNNMQKHKFWYLRQFLDRPNNCGNFKKFVSTIGRLESTIRGCYAQTFDYLPSHEFIHMILVDAGFICELFLRYRCRQLREPDDPISCKPWLRTDIQQDLILLENQLPFFILEGLYDLAFPLKPNYFPSFRELTCSYFFRYINQKSFEQITSLSFPQEVKHFTDLLRSFQLPEFHLPMYLPNFVRMAESMPEEDVIMASEPMPETAVDVSNNDKLKQNDRIDHLYSATELHDAGVKFKVSKSQCFLDTDIKYEHGKLTIPCLTLDDNKERFIRNLMALEQCHYPKKTYICEYVSVMDHLVNNVKDVDLLVETKIIVNMLGGRVPVATLFNNLCTHIVLLYNSRYISLRENLYHDINRDRQNTCYHRWEVRCQKWKVRCQKWKALLRQEYFNSPWRSASTIAAIILLALTLTQTICAIISL